MSRINSCFLLLPFFVFSSFNQFESLFEGEEVRALLYHKGELWASTPSGLYTVEEFRKQEIELPLEDDLVTTLVEGDENTVYAGTYNGKLLIIKDRVPVVKELPSVGSFNTFYVVNLALKDGNLWIATLEGVIFKYAISTGQFDNFTLKTYNRKTFLNINGLAVDDDGNIWAGSQDKIYFLTTLYSGRKELVYDFLGSSIYDVTPMYMATGDDGIYVVAQQDGKNSLSVGSLNRAFMDATRKNIDLPEEVKTGDILAFEYEGNGQFWLLHEKLYKYDGQSWTSFDISGIGNSVYDLEVYDSKIWVGSNAGLRAVVAK